MLWFINSFAGFASAIARWCCGHLYKRSLLKKLVANHFLIQFPCIFLKQLKRTWNQRIGRFCSVDTTFNWVCCPWYFPRYFFGWTGASCELLPSYLEWLNSNVFFGRNDGEPSVSCAPFCFSSHSKSKLTRHLHVFLFSFEWTLSPFFSLFFFPFCLQVSGTDRKRHSEHTGRSWITFNLYLQHLWKQDGKWSDLCHLTFFSEVSWINQMPSLRTFWGLPAMCHQHKQ
jgi:hypothetical protein